MNLGRKTHKGKTAMTNQRQESRVINDGTKLIFKMAWIDLLKDAKILPLFLVDINLRRVF